MKNIHLVLASSSAYRQSLLAKLNLPFQCFSPDIDESHFKNESPIDLVKRLAKQKAKAVAAHHPNSLIIGSDQVCVINQQILSKPKTKENAIKQLQASSEKTVTFYTGLCLFNAKTQSLQLDVELFHVHFKKLSLLEIENYIEMENPLDCAGSFKSEGLGIALFERLEGRDPNALVGLPLILLCEMLKKEGINPLAQSE